MDVEFDDVVLTARGHALLRSRLAKLGDQMRSTLSTALRAGAFDGEVASRYQRASSEHAALLLALLEARPLDSVPADPETVLVGDRVRVRKDDGAVESLIVVHPLESFLDNGADRADPPRPVATDSQLGRALLGRKVSDHVEVQGPAGPYRCRILSADRERPVSWLPYSARDPGSTNPA
jgi:transcription elongation GreA/GreB family factor